MSNNHPQPPSLAWAFFLFQNNPVFRKKEFLQMDYLHGIHVIEVNDGVRAVRTVSTAVIGVVCTGDDADEASFPLNKPILTTNPKTLMAKAGKTGTLYRTLETISNIVSTPTVIIRVPDAQGDELTANVIGTIAEDGTGTGIQALADAKALLGVKPRILACPGLDNKDVTTALVAMAKKLNSFCYASCVANSKEEAIQYRKNFGDRELMLIYGDYVNFNVKKGVEDICYASACAVALRAKTDKEIGWMKNISNLTIPGVSGVSKVISFDIQDSSTTANFLNQNDISVSIREDGFRIWGARTTSSDKLYAFEQATRTAQIIKDSFGQAFLWAIDAGVANVPKEVVDSMNQKFREWVSGGYLIGGKAWIDKEDNNASSVLDGIYRIRYDFCPVPSIECLEMRQYITDEYLVDLTAKQAGGK